MSASVHSYLISRLSAIVLTCLAAVPAPSTAAQDAKPADVRLLRAQLQQEVLIAILPEKKTYRDQLLALEKRFAAEQDFESAIRSRNERLEVEKELVRFEKEIARLRSAVVAPSPGQIELKSSTAIVTGVQHDGKQGYLAGWDSPEATATWPLSDVVPGGYEVLIQCTGDGGPVTVKESFYSLQADIKPVGGKPVAQNLGTLRIKDGKGSLTLATNSPEKCKGLRVYAIVLVPCAR